MELHSQLTSKAIVHTTQFNKSNKLDERSDWVRDWIDFLVNDVNWIVVIMAIAGHSLAAFGFYYSIVNPFNWRTVLCVYVLSILVALGSLAGAHRLFAHRSYKARLPLKLFLLLCQTMSGQQSAITWARQHRTHHKFTETNKDCSNIKRGFFYAHIGWLLLKTEPECQKAMDECDVSDLLNDPWIKFQYDYYGPLFMLINVILPSIIPYYFWGDTLMNGFLMCFALRYIYTLHVAFCGKFDSTQLQLNQL